ncbi:MAG: ABC transporter ATP-binding protein [Chloroflexi bacterium]|nr:ABC transporter ATP-binding protein [Chloroflexota bacterium]
MGREEPLLRMRGITKTFGGVVANDHVDFDVHAGEVHALLGENGAGKTTLMEILYGLYTADGGEIAVRGETVHIRSPHDAMRHGIGMVHQHFMLIPVLSVCENIVLGMPGRFNPRQASGAIRELSRRFGLEVDPDARTGILPIGMQQRVEIVRVLYRGATLLILDEPTAVLTPIETEALMRFMRSMAQQGHSVVIITHKLEEVLEVSDRVTVLRHGRKIAALPTRETNEAELARLMVGRDVKPIVSTPRNGAEAPCLQVEDLSVRDERGTLRCEGVTFRLCRGEILGIAGVTGNGQTELAEAITGLRRPSSGRISLLDADVTGASPRRLIRSGVAHVPEDRKATGCVGAFSLADNLILGRHRERVFARRGLLRRRTIREFGERLVREFDVRSAGLGTAVQVLSGGNVQKLILARELQGDPTLVVAVEPTRGLDVGAIEYVHRTLLRLRQAGVAVLLVSSDLAEIFALSDRIGVMYRGRLLGPFPAETVDLERVGYLMTAGEVVA